jgi:drug/metabolite transporter (DMT)-like permease
LEAAVKKSYWQLHIAVFLFGFTAILGKLMSLNEIALVWWRLFFTVVTYLLYPAIRNYLRNIDKKLTWQLAANGVLVMLHWVSFYASIKYSGVSVTLSIYATASLMTAFIEPLLFNKPLKISEVLLGLLVIPGIYLVFSFSGVDWWGIVLALFSTVVGVAFTIYNKLFTEKTNAFVITFVELASGLVVLTLLLPVYYYFYPDHSFYIEQGMDWFYLAIFVVLCTHVAYTISISALKNLSAFTAMLSFNLEPVYGILLAALFFQENKELSWQFYLGTSIIVTAIFLQPLLNLVPTREKKGR